MNLDRPGRKSSPPTRANFEDSSQYVNWDDVVRNRAAADTDAIARARGLSPEERGMERSADHDRRAPEQKARLRRWIKRCLRAVIGSASKETAMPDQSRHTYDDFNELGHFEVDPSAVQLLSQAFCRRHEVVILGKIEDIDKICLVYIFGIS